MQRLFIDCTVATCRISGIERYVRELIPRVCLLMLEKDYRITIALSSTADWWSLSLEQNVAVDVIYLSSKNRIIKDYIDLPYFAKKSGVDYAWFPALPPSPIFFLANPNCIILRTIFDAVMWKNADTLSKGNRFYYRPLEEYGIQRYDKIHTISEFSKSELIECFPSIGKKIIVSGIGVNSFTNTIKLAICHDWNNRLVDQRIILFVSTLEPRKNLPFLLRVFKQIMQERSDVILVIAGRFGWGTDEVQKTLADLNLHESVVLTGAVDDTTLTWLYNRADIFVFPSLSEGFGLPVVEAMSAGLPVISSNAGALPEAAGEAAILLSPYDMDAWVKAICSLLDNAEMRNSMIKLGFEQAARFTWDAVAERIAETL